ncbi:hypothetical protein J9B83_05865 [Marinomonas sp. A79]|uniref:Uncharacterized protein n=1 Tax=Marinomonas vulgaris TaxID=2823372 RepID=A0ABS5HAH0_9GAMM|nr:hypothetical protein [Marinomonas vulgaris]MBR7888465.1 hypothetical protein [Marinomonas vulgaris]
MYSSNIIVAQKIKSSFPEKANNCYAGNTIPSAQPFRLDESLVYKFSVSDCYQSKNSVFFKQLIWPNTFNIGKLKKKFTEGNKGIRNTPLEHP